MRIISLLFLFLFSISFLNAQDKVNLLRVGDKIPEFKITKGNGKVVTSKKFENKTVVLVFFATWCSPCLKELPHVQKEIWNEFKSDKNFELVVIGREHTYDELFAFVKKHGFTFPIVADTDRSIFSIFATQNIPRLYLIDKNGRIKLMNSGFREQSFKLLVHKLKEELSSYE